MRGAKLVAAILGFPTFNHIGYLFGMTDELITTSIRPGRRTSRVAFAEVVRNDDPLLDFAPYVHAAPRRNSITPERQRAFIATLAATGIVSQAARAIGVSLEAVYKLRHRSGAEGFATAWDAAVERGYSRLEDCALERAIAGEERPVVWDGKVVATWKRHDTALLMFLLRQRRPEKFGIVRLADLRPGHPVHDRLRAQWLAEWRAKGGDDEDIAAVRASLQAKLLAMRDAALARKAADAGVATDDAVDATKIF